MSKPKIIVVGIPGDTPAEFAFSETAKLFDQEKVELLRVKAPDDLVAMVAGEQIHAVVLAGHLAKAPDAVAGFLMGPTILIIFRMASLCSILLVASSGQMASSNHFSTGEAVTQSTSSRLLVHQPGHTPQVIERSR